MSVDEYAAWREALAGGAPPMHEDSPWCGYFKTRDHKASTPGPRGRWPTVPCAIWRDADGALKAERSGEFVPPEWLWPHCAKNPIPYETYARWYEARQWPEEQAA